MRGFGFRGNSFLYGLIVLLLCFIGILLTRDSCLNRLTGAQRGGPPDTYYSGHHGVAPAVPDNANPIRSLQRVVTYDDVASRRDSQEYSYGTDSAFIFIGGVPRSGTTLMRAMLDAHPEVRCGEETRVIPRILSMRANWKNSAKESMRLKNAGIGDDVIDAAVSSFILEIITRHGHPAPRLCNKDPFTMKSIEYLSKIFPKAKFILMIRDGRAVVHSIITRKVTITGFDLNNPRKCLEKWNQAITTMYHQCYLVGESVCFPMYYEQLVLHPKEQLESVLSFLGLAWNDSVLHHEKLIGKKISLSKTERSTDQVIKPVNLDALTSWVGTLPADVVRDMAKVAPMLAHLGYDPHEKSPNYGQADESVIKNTKDIHRKDSSYWKSQLQKLFTGNASASAHMVHPRLAGHPDPVN